MRSEGLFAHLMFIWVGFMALAILGIGGATLAAGFYWYPAATFYTLLGVGIGVPICHAIGEHILEG